MDLLLRAGLTHAGPKLCYSTSRVAQEDATASKSSLRSHESAALALAQASYAAVCNSCMRVHYSLHDLPWFNGPLWTTIADYCTQAAVFVCPTRNSRLRSR